MGIKTSLHHVLLIFLVGKVYLYFPTMVQRLIYRRRNTHKTNSNKVKIVKTPGGRLVFQHVKKRPSLPSCTQCTRKLPGITPLRPADKKRAPRRQKTVTRAYGGHFCHKCVKQRILRAFLVEEQRIVAKVMKIQKQAAKDDSKSKK